MALKSGVIDARSNSTHRYIVVSGNPQKAESQPISGPA